MCQFSASHLLPLWRHGSSKDDLNLNLKAEVEWPSHSPDLTPPDFFLWGYLKNRVYGTNPKSLQELQNNIRSEVRKISLETCRAAINAVQRRAALCLQRNGGHMENMLHHC